MSRSRKIFIAFVIVFILLLAYASYDFSRRTSFPGSGASEKEKVDATASDSLTSN